MGDTNRIACGEPCAEVWFPHPSPCATCFPGVHPFNDTAMQAYQMCNDQFIMGPAGPVGINLVAVGYILDNCFTDIDIPDALDRIRILASLYIAGLMKGAKNA